MSVKVSSPLRVVYMKFPMSMNIIRRRLKDFLARSSDDVEYAVSYDDVYGCGWVLPGHHVRYIQAFDKVVDKSLYRYEVWGSFFLFIQTFILFYILFLVNGGELRAYVFIACLLGFSAYQLVGKRWYMKLLERILSVVAAIYRFIAHLVRVMIVLPIIYIFRFVIT